jgi:hypothetical protein
VAPPHRPHVTRFPSLALLFEALERRAVPAVEAGGAVRVHPSQFAERGVLGLLEARRRVGAHGLALVLTPAVGVECVEVRSGRPAAPG